MHAYTLTSVVVVAAARARQRGGGGGIPSCGLPRIGHVCFAGVHLLFVGLFGLCVWYVVVEYIYINITHTHIYTSIYEHTNE